jgi:hypothetical protein
MNSESYKAAPSLYARKPARDEAVIRKDLADQITVIMAKWDERLKG